MNEFSLIKRYFSRSPRHSAALLGVGDDAALWRPVPGSDMAVAADMLVAGRHFFADDDAFDIGYKALAVNVSDMAAMGAVPRAVTLCLALPEAEPGWLERFSAGFWELADHFGIDLIGGDTTRGPLTIALQIWGELPAGRGLFRHAARDGDDIWVSGCLGSAALGLQLRLGQLRFEEGLAQRCLQRLHRPEPRALLGHSLLELAHAAIDISDGLLADLGHIVQASGVGASLDYCRVPLDPELESMRHDQRVREAALAGGDDYELCFTAAPDRRQAIEALGRHMNLPLARIGSINKTMNIQVQGEHGEPIHIGRAGYDHFGPDHS